MIPLTGEAKVKIRVRRGYEISLGFVDREYDIGFSCKCPRQWRGSFCVVVLSCTGDEPFVVEISYLNLNECGLK
jgi:hypothetical protein